MDCQIASIDSVIDASTLEVPTGRNGADGGGRRSTAVQRNDVAEITLQMRKPLVIDNHDRIPALGRFVLVDEREVSGGGIIFGGVYTDRHRVVSQHITWSESEVTSADRSLRNGHKGAVVWLTGLSGAGKSTIAKALERELFERRFHVYVLDGDNIRYGLNSNLGFSPEDRLENIRRVGEVARLMADSGTVTITAFISPYRTDRRRAREIALEGGCEFIEVYVNASLETCERRDPKNLYKKARAGEIKQFTGIDAPYEAPEDAEIVVHTDRADGGRVRADDHGPVAAAFEFGVKRQLASARRAAALECGDMSPLSHGSAGSNRDTSRPDHPAQPARSIAASPEGNDATCRWDQSGDVSRRTPKPLRGGGAELLHSGQRQNRLRGPQRELVKYFTNRTCHGGHPVL